MPPSNKLAGRSGASLSRKAYLELAGEGGLEVVGLYVKNVFVDLEVGATALDGEVGVHAGVEHPAKVSHCM